MDDSEDHLLTSLKVISMIKEGQKVCVRNGHLTLEIQSTGLVASMRRWLNKDSRTATINYIKSVINNSIVMSKTHRNQDSVEKLVIGMNESLTGINSLIVTYAEDATVAATLQVLHNRITTELKVLNDM
jgi:hypothetical protein